MPTEEVLRVDPYVSPPHTPDHRVLCGSGDIQHQCYNWGHEFFVFFAQVITTTFSIDAGGDVPIGSEPGQSYLVSIYKAFYSIWQLDIVFPDFCYHNPLSTPTTLLLSYTEAIYPLILIAIFLIIVKLHDHGVQPFYGVGKWVYGKIRRFRQPWTVKRTVIHALATFLVLSYTKITAVSFIILSRTGLINHNGTTVRWVPMYYGDITHSSLLYILVALLFLTTMVIFPTLLLLALPTLFIPGFSLPHAGCSSKLDKVLISGS